MSKRLVRMDIVEHRGGVQVIVTPPRSNVPRDDEDQDWSSPRELRLQREVEDIKQKLITSDRIIATLQDARAELERRRATEKVKGLNPTKERLEELVSRIRSSALYEQAEFDHLREDLPKEEKDVTDFIRRRTEVYTRTWIVEPLRELEALMQKLLDQAQ